MTNIKYRDGVGIEKVMLHPRTRPINPATFIDKMKERILDLQPEFKFGSAMEKAFETYCAVYNDVTHNNKIGGKNPIRFAIPAPTGSGKSVSSQLYLSMIPKLGYSGLLVVSKVREAIEAVKAINKLAGEEVAVCSYSTKGKYKTCPQHREIDGLRQYPIVVITHRMFTIKSHATSGLHRFNTYENKNRQCIIIDEKINFQETVYLLSSDVKKLMGYVELPLWPEAEEILMKLITFDPDKTKFKSLKLHKDLGVLKAVSASILNGNGYVGKEIDREINPEADGKRRVMVTGILDKIIYICSDARNRISKIRGSVRFSRTEDITNRFGSVAILDATMHEDMVCDAHSLNREDIRNINFSGTIRNYQNATLHICHDKARRQSRDAMYKGITKQQQKILVREYLEELYAIAGTGNLLAIIFKELRELFIAECNNDKIQFCHWGQHDSRNDLSHHTKVAIVGWNRIDPEKFKDDIHIIAKKGRKYIPIGEDEKTDAYAMQLGHVVSSAIQAFNRSASRVAVDTQGNCIKVDWYMFDDGSQASPFADIENALPGLVIKQWAPIKASNIAVPVSKADARNKRMVHWMANDRAGENVLFKDLAERFGLETNTIIKLLRKNEKFISLLKKNGIQFITKKGRYGGSYFVVPEMIISQETRDTTVSEIMG